MHEGGLVVTQHIREALQAVGITFGHQFDALIPFSLPAYPDAHLVQIGLLNDAFRDARLLLDQSGLTVHGYAEPLMFRVALVTYAETLV